MLSTISGSELYVLEKEKEREGGRERGRKEERKKREKGREGRKGGRERKPFLLAINYILINTCNCSVKVFMRSVLNYFANIET